MLAHRLDYGSIEITWAEPEHESGWVNLGCRCTCGLLLTGDGATFPEAARQLARRLADHSGSDAYRGREFVAGEAQ